MSKNVFQNGTPHHRELLQMIGHTHMPSTEHETLCRDGSLYVRYYHCACVKFKCLNSIIFSDYLTPPQSVRGSFTSSPATPTILID